MEKVFHYFAKLAPCFSKSSRCSALSHYFEKVNLHLQDLCSSHWQKHVCRLLTLFCSDSMRLMAQSLQASYSPLGYHIASYFNRKIILRTQIRLPKVQPGIKSVCGRELGLCERVRFRVLRADSDQTNVWVSLFPQKQKRALCSNPTHWQKALFTPVERKWTHDWWRLLHRTGQSMKCKMLERNHLIM